MTLRELRERTGLRQSDVAEKIGTDQSVVSKWETGDHFPHRIFRKPLSKLYGVTVDELLSCDGSKETPRL